MRKVLLSLLLILLLLGCQGTSQAEALAPTAAATEAPTPVPTATPLPPTSALTIIVSAAPVTATPTISPDATLVATPFPTPTPSPTPEPTPFTMVWMSDTQHMSRNNPDVFNTMRDWILNNREKENIQFVVHTGDVVDSIGTVMFENANNALVPLFETLPGMIVSGNHDVTQSGKPWHFTQQPFAKLVHKEARPCRKTRGPTSTPPM